MTKKWTRVTRLFVLVSRLTLTLTLLTTALLSGPKRASVAGSPAQVARIEPAQTANPDPAQNMPLDRLMTPEPPPTTMPDSSTVIPTDIDTQPPPSLPTPSPEQIEEAKARRAIEMALAKYLHEAGLPHVVVTEVVVEGNWAYGVTEPQQGSEPFYVLAQRGANEEWQAALPGVDDVYVQWLNSAPQSLVPIERKLALQQTADTSMLSQMRRYVSEPLGIEVDLPEDWSVNEYQNVDYGFAFYAPDLQLGPMGEPLAGVYITVDVLTSTFDSTAFTLEDISVSRADLTVGGNPAFRYISQKYLIHEEIVTDVYKDDLLYRFTLHNNPQKDSNEKAQNVQALDTILNSLVFIPRAGSLPVREPTIMSSDISLAFPFEYGKNWEIVNGYGGGRNHTGKSLYALDFAPQNNDWNGVIGALAPENLKIFHYRTPDEKNYNYYCLWAKLGEPAQGRIRVLEVCHVVPESYLKPVRSTGQVTCASKNQLLGRIANVGEDPQMGTQRHVHIAVWEGDETLPFNNTVPLPFDSDHGLTLEGHSLSPGTSHEGRIFQSNFGGFCGSGTCPSLSSQIVSAPSSHSFPLSPLDVCGSGGNSCSAPVLDTPSDGAILTHNTITFHWQPVSSCTFNGYTFRVCPSTDLDDLSHCIDTGESNTQRTETIPNEWNNRDLYWSVKAANAPGGADWAPIRSFHIQSQPSCNPPGNAVALFWNAGYACGGHDPVWRSTPGWSNVPGWFNDKASSVRVPSGWSVRLFAHADRGQPSKCFNGSDDNFESETFDGSSLNLNDQVSSYEVFDRPNCSSAQSGTWHAEYFRHKELFDRIFDTYLDTPYIFFDWGSGGPRPDWPNNDDWGARFTRRVHFEGGEYHFHVHHDDGARVYLDGQLILDAWWDSSFSGHDTVKNVSSGEHEVKLEYYERQGDARVEFWWRGPGALPMTTRDPGQWWVQYHPNRHADGAAPLQLNEGSGFIYHEWGIGGPGYDLPADRFSANYERTVDFDCGQYRFNLSVDDGVRFWVDDTLVVDEWHNGVSDYQPDVMELSGEHTLKLKYYENGGSAALRLSWEKVAPCDDDPPTGRIISPDNLSATNHNTIVIQAEANDSDTGVDRVEFWAHYDGSWQHHLGDDTTAPYSFEWGVSAVTDQHIQLAIRVFDKAGNKVYYAGGIVIVTLDRATPTGGITSPSQGSYLTSDNIPIVVSANDSGSGIKDVVFLVSTCGTGQWTSIGTDTNGADGWGMTWDASDVPDCGVGIHVIIHDRAGNTRNTGIGATLDRNPPTSFVNGLSDVQRTESFQVSWSGYDAPSGIVQYQVQVRDGTAGTWTTWYTGSASSATYGGQNGHTYYFRCRAVDAAGNPETYPGGNGDTSTTVQTDTEPPVGSIIINDHAGFTANHAVSLTLSATDNGAVTEMQFAIWNPQTRVWDWTDWYPYATSHSFTLTPGDGWKTVWVHFRDNASNISEWATDSIVVDTVAPASSVFGLSPVQSSERFPLSWRGLDDLYSDWPSDGVNIVYRDAIGWAQDVFVQDQYVYVAAGTAGLRVVDISNPSFVKEVGQLETDRASGVYISGTLAYVADGWAGLRVISVADPTAPVEVGSLDTPDYAGQVQVVGSYAYVADSGAGLRVISVVNPTNPVEVDYYDTPGAAYDVHVVGDYAYVADYSDGGLRIISVADPTDVVEVGYYDTPGWTEGVFVSDQIAYVADWSSLRIISVADPANPTQIGYYYAPSFIHKVFVSDSLAYLAADVAGLQIISVTDPAWPTLVSHYDTPGLLLHLDTAGQHMALADAEAGLQMVNVTDPESPSGYGFSVAGYSVDYREAPGGGWIPWESNTLATTAEFSGQDNQQYCFRSHGQDWANNFEDPQYDWGVDGRGADTCTTVHAPVIDVSGFTVDDDQLGESYGNSDGEVNPGEFIELDLSLENDGSGDAEGVFIQPTTSDSCIDTSGAYFYDGYVYHGGLTSGQTGESLDDFDFMVRSDCSPGHNIVFDLSIGDTSGNSWQRALNVPVVGADTTPPGIWYEGVSPKYVLPDESTLLSAFVVEQSDVAWARADIQSTDGTFTTTLTLYDDGAHNDGEAGDRFFANEWTPPVEADFEATILAADDYGNVGVGVPVHFTSQRFVARSDILLVYDDWDYQWASGVLTYYTEALEANGLPYDLWDAIYRGPVLTDTLMSYRDGVVIWAMPQFGNLGYKPEVQRALERYLDGGGRLFISGQDVGFYLTWDGTMTNTLCNDYLHAQFVRDDVNLYALDGYEDDPVFAGSHLSISGGDGASNQRWPSEIAPVSPALPIYAYDTTAFRAIAASVPDDTAYQQPERNQAPDGPPRGSNKPDSASVPLSTTSDSVGAIKADTGIYRVVYFAFGFEAINGQNGETRAEVLDKVIHWLLPNRPPRRPDYPYPRPDAHISGSAPTSTPSATATASGEPVADHGVELWWAANDPDPGDAVSFDVYLGTTPVLTESARVSAALTETFFIPGPLTTGTTYYWQIVAWDSYDMQAVGPVWSFVYGQVEHKIYLPLLLRNSGDVAFRFESGEPE